MSLTTRSVAELAEGLQRGEFSSEELTQEFLARIEQLNPHLNALITVTAEEALASARAADQRRAAGQAGPLTGIPLVHKDLLCTQGVLTSCGSKMLANFIAPYDATVVQRCREAGLVMLGKANMDEFAMGSSNENSYFGPVHNPWQLDRVPGGSSGGSAAAVAADLAPLATGTDTGGSIRQPAALCGITGLKPTYGRVSRYGLVAFASSLDQAGVMGRSAADVAALMQIIAGFDERDSTSADTPVPDYHATLGESIRGLRVGLPAEYFGEGLDPGVQAVVEAALGQLRELGAETVPVQLPRSELAVPAYYVVAPAEASSNLARYDGVRYGYRCQDPQDLHDLYTRSRGEGFGREVQRRIMVGTYVLSAGYYDAYYLKAQQIRRLIRDDFQQALSEVDLLASPTTPTVAFGLGDKVDDPVTMYLNDIYTTAVNLAGLPGISLPAGFHDGLPVGLQLIGDYFSEPRLLQVSHAFQQATDWHTRRPVLAVEEAQ